MFVLAETEFQKDLDIAIIRAGGAGRVSALESGAELQRFTGKQALTTGFVEAGGTLLSSAGKFKQKPKKPKKSTLP